MKRWVFDVVQAQPDEHGTWVLLEDATEEIERIMTALRLIDEARAKALNELAAARNERDAVRADAETLRMEYQRQRDMAISAKALLDAMPDELRQRVADAERIAAELRTYLRRYEEEHRKLLAERDEARAEVERLRELMTDRESDLRYEYLRRVEAEDTIDKVKQALRIAAAGVSAASTAEEMYAELERLRTAAQDFANVALRYAPTSTGRAWHEAWDVLMDALEV